MSLTLNIGSGCSVEVFFVETQESNHLVSWTHRAATDGKLNIIVTPRTGSVLHAALHNQFEAYGVTRVIT